MCPGGAATTSRLELTVTNLAALVDALAWKDWGVQAKVRNSAAMSQIRKINGLT